MSISFSEKAAPLWLNRLIHTFQTIKLGESDDDLLNEQMKIKEELNIVKNLLENRRTSRAQKLQYQFNFAKLNLNLRGVADYGNISLMLDKLIKAPMEMEASVTSRTRQGTTEGSNRILEGELPVLLNLLRDTITKNNADDKHDPLVMKFNRMERELNYMTFVFHRVKQWEQELLHLFKEMEHYLSNFDCEVISALVDSFHKKNFEMESLLGELWKRRDKGVTDAAMNFVKALSAFQSHIGVIIHKNRKHEEHSLIEKLDWFKRKLNRTRDLFLGAKESEQELVKQLMDLDRYLGRFGVPRIKSLFECTLEMLRNSASQLEQISSSTDKHEHNEDDQDQTQKPSKDYTLPHPQVFFSRKVSERDEAMNTATRTFLESDPCNRQLPLRHCMIFLSFFPEDAVIKKRPLIYLWLSEGLIPTEDKGEALFEELLNTNIIIPYDTGKSPVVNQFQIHPDISYTLFSLSKNVELFNFDAKEIVSYSRSSSSGSVPAGIVAGEGAQSKKMRTIFNLEERNLSFEWKWLAQLDHLVVLQLGRWHGSREHHIQVRSEAILKGLGSQKHLKYLSLRGIWGITALPSSIFELTSLEILDLKACFNLGTLPPGISSLKKLTHLDISDCYLLESMPEGLHNLSSLQVLKGFVIGYAKNHTPCRIGHLARFQKLKRLSICVGNDSVLEDKEFEKLKNLVSLRHLKIAWDVLSPERINQIVKQPLTFPPSLEKLDLEGIPHDKMPEWLEPVQLKELKKLYIRGGKLTNLEYGETLHKFKIEILLLEYLENMQIELPQLQDMFPLLRYVKVEDLGKNHDHCFEWRKEGSEGSTSKPELGKSAA